MKFYEAWMAFEHKEWIGRYMWNGTVLLISPNGRGQQADLHVCEPVDYRNFHKTHSESTNIYRVWIDRYETPILQWRPGSDRATTWTPTQEDLLAEDWYVWSRDQYTS